MENSQNTKNIENNQGYSTGGGAVIRFMLTIAAALGTGTFIGHQGGYNEGRKAAEIEFSQKMSDHDEPTTISKSKDVIEAVSQIRDGINNLEEAMNQSSSEESIDNAIIDYASAAIKDPDTIEDLDARPQLGSKKVFDSNVSPNNG